ncbi:hypothetical protein EYF80_060092 [Liparis tanakae]|uniref:Laminin IV type A domain-containing protein n=1 Tax=Liparis tanakae TaxID=230148 RepID=A0A4Z2ELU0_9TELE|nr:hypothetical protein EYF80_060092 [Liparis tanakae]
MKLTPPTSPDTRPLIPPEKFLGRQVLSYGQLLSITFTSETAELLPDHVALLLRGSSGAALSADLSPQPALRHDLALRRSFVTSDHKYINIGKKTSEARRSHSASWLQDAGKGALSGLRRQRAERWMSVRRSVGQWTRCEATGPSAA